MSIHKGGDECPKQKQMAGLPSSAELRIGGEPQSSQFTCTGTDAYLTMAEVSSSSNHAETSFNKARHIKYWLRCLKTYLPTAYITNDSQRMTLAFFSLSALDLLSALHTNTTVEERSGYMDWIYRCQHQKGGFKGFTGADAGNEATDEGKRWDPANLAATFFALATLIVLGDDMARVKKRLCLDWMSQLQRSNGSFGEALGRHGEVEGGNDVRWFYLSAAIRWILRRGDPQGVGDIDTIALKRFVKNSVVGFLITVVRQG